MPRYPIAQGNPRMSNGPCRACQADMWWVMTAGGSKMPLDPDVDREHGNVVLRESDNRAVVLADHQAAEDYLFVHGGDGPYSVHFATCPARQKDKAEPAVTQERLL